MLHRFLWALQSFILHLSGHFFFCCLAGALAHFAPGDLLGGVRHLLGVPVYRPLMHQEQELSEGCRTVNIWSGSPRRLSAILKKGTVLGEIEVNKWFHIYAWNNWGESGEFWWRFLVLFGSFLGVCIGDSGVNMECAGPEVEYATVMGRADLSTYTAKNTG